MSKQTTESTREGGREGAKPLTSGLSGEAPSAPMRNSSGSATAAASILDLRQKVNRLIDLVERIADGVGDADGANACRQLRQLGFVRPRRP